MADERTPDDEITIEIEGGHRVVAYSYGPGNEVLFCLNGGPGLPCDYLREPHGLLADQGYRVVTYDQLGCGRSDKPDDASLWTISRYVEEVDEVRRRLGLGRIHLLGHSWGGWLAIEYGITYPENLKTIILEDTCADMPHLVSELERHRAALGPETIAMMQRHEAEGTLEHPEYEAAITILNYRHVCRLDEWPAPLKRSLDGWNMAIYPRLHPQRGGRPARDRRLELGEEEMLLAGFCEAAGRPSGAATLAPAPRGVSAGSGSAS